MAAIQQHLTLERNFERLKKLTSRDMLLLPRERTMVHWGAVFLARAETYVTVRSRLMARSLWVKLIKTRLLGPGGQVTGSLEDDDLVALSVRQTNLAKTEAYLAEALTKLRQRRRDLVALYEQRGVAEANRTAALTLQARLGATAGDALASPPVRALGEYVKTAAAPITAQAAKQRLDSAVNRGAERTSGLLAACRNLVIARLKDPGVGVSARSQGRFKAVMQQLDDLEDETREAYGQILGTAPAAARLKVQNSGAQAKTEPSVE